MRSAIRAVSPARESDLLERITVSVALHFAAAGQAGCEVGSPPDTSANAPE